MNIKPKRGVVRGAIEYKKWVYIAVALLILVGAIGLVKMNKDEFPTFEIKQGLVVGVYPGATAKEVKNQLTEPLEEILFTFPEVSRSATTSYSRDGVCYIYVDLTTPAEEKTEVWSKIKLKLNSKKSTLPAGVLTVAVIDEFSAVSALLISMESDDKGPQEMSDYANELAKKLREIPEMASVTILGAKQEEVAVKVDADKLSQYGVSMSSLMLNYQTLTLPTSYAAIENDDTRLPLFVKSTIASEKEIADYIVYSDAEGRAVRLKDVATIERAYKNTNSEVRFNGKSAIVLSLEMRPNNNIVEFGNKVDDVLNDYTKFLPPSVKINRITDQPKVVLNSINSFIRDLLISMLVVVVVMLLLFPMRSALIASSGVPVCTFVAIAVMYVCHIDLNTVTLAALIVVLGMIVDDSIITMDGYMVHMEKSTSRIDAAVASAHELFLPMFMATAAISAMFFPIKAIITGYLGDFVALFPWVIAIALAASLAYAVLVVPSFEVKFIKHAQHTDDNIISRWQKHFFKVLQRLYDAAQSYCFKYPRLTILVGVVAVLLGILMFFSLNVQMMPMAARDYFAIEVYMPANATFEATRATVDDLEKMLLTDKRVKNTTSFIGVNAPRFNATYAPLLPSPIVAQIIVKTKSAKATEAILKEGQSKYLRSCPDATLHFKQMDYRANTLPIDIQISGSDIDALRPFADSICAFMLTMPELQWVHCNSNSIETSMQVNLNTDLASRLGVNKSALSLYLSSVYSGCTIATLWEDNKSIPVAMYALQSQSPGWADVGNRRVPTYLPGNDVALNQVADVVPEYSYYQYVRAQGADVLQVAGDMNYGVSYPAVLKKIKRYISEHLESSLPEGTKIEYRGLSGTNEKVIPEILISFVCAVMVLFLFLLFHFKKGSIALLTIVLSSLCLFGAFFGLWIFKLDFGITSVLGLISLVGIIVRNGIIMFEYAEELHFKRGLDIKLAAEEAGKRRMRPIFLTSCTTALGVLPMIISADALWMPMGVVICFGTLLTIVLITLIMPVSYWLVFRKSE